MRHNKIKYPSADIKIDHATMVRKKGLRKTGLSKRQTNATVYVPRLKMIVNADNINGGRKRKAEKSETFGKWLDALIEKNANKQNAHKRR